MQSRGRTVRTGAQRAAIFAVLCALVVCINACDAGIEPAATPYMTPDAQDAVELSAPHDTAPADLPASTSGGTAAPESAAPPYEPISMRAVWVASVLNIDFPSEQGRDEEALKAEFLQILDNAKAWNLDAVLVQVRPMGDALYRSELNPWSSFLTGTQGADPGWDPLEFMVSEAHDRGLQFHAWLNPYRVTHPGSGFTTQDFAEDSFAAQHPDWLITHEGYTYLDPGREEVKQHIAETVREIVDGYDVDGIHFDDYFYPSEYPLPDGAERDGYIDMERRANINDMLRRVSVVCREADHPVVFGVSPFGIWKNASSDPAGSDTQGAESYYDTAADSVRWIREGIIDYIAPQLYWPIGHSRADYETLVEWWADQVRGTDVSLLIGQGVHDSEVIPDLLNELELNLQFPEVTGSIYFSYADLAGNPVLADTIKAFYEVHPEAGMLTDAAAASPTYGAPDSERSSAPDSSGAAS